MCGRFALDTDKNTFTSHYPVSQMEITLVPHYNIAPGSLIPVVYSDNKLIARMMFWGLVPHWSKELKTKFATFNARSETLQSSPAYREPFLTKRCLIPATGFYEWQKLNKKDKQPYYIYLKDQKIFSFAGIYDIYKDIEGKQSWSCSIITSEPNSVIKDIHNRMPVILDKSQEKVWLESENITFVKLLLQPYPNIPKMETRQIGLSVNNPELDTKEITNEIHDKWK